VLQGDGGADKGLLVGVVTVGVYATGGSNSDAGAAAVPATPSRPHIEKESLKVPLLPPSYDRRRGNLNG
jgi:hypothetical protein